MSLWSDVLSLLILFPALVDLLNNGLALKPPMGWLSWGYHECQVDCKNTTVRCLDESLIMSVADHLFNDGYIEAGYEYVIIDDCWSEPQRNEFGQLVPDRERFSRGMKFLADYIHSKGLKFGMYTSLGTYTCKGYPGIRDHFEIDAATFASWDVDFLKVDGCFIKADYLNTGYIDLSRTLNKTGRPILYTCSWPYYIQFIENKMVNFEPIVEHCNLFRTYHDIFHTAGNIYHTVKFFESSYDLMKKYHGPGQWFDPDMLLVGRGLNPTKGIDSFGWLRLQMVVYAMLPAPLLISCNLDAISQKEKELLLNKDLVAINQDMMAVPAQPFAIDPFLTIWVKPHEPKKGNMNPACSFAVVNFHFRDVTIPFFLHKYAVCEPFTRRYSVMDVLNRTFLKNITSLEPIHVTVPSSDAVVYTLFPL
ncbi:unnamed protein product [Plutella xylostella]|uniref:Alpha-galactosidase n=1 Tax=Plutella xylostella TaxID=51655 RepID=A0A8S4G5H5_PLUXY|nr:unnamed protein product [Plutella xylostella]